MSPHSRPPNRFVPAFRRASSRVRRGHVVALSAAAAAAFGLVGLRAVDLPGPTPLGDERLRIEVVHPVEPEIVAGSVMEVGDLEDGFQGLPPPLPPLEDFQWPSYDEEWETALLPPPAPRRPAVEPAVYRPPEPREPAPRREGRWFGFDAPRRDYQAERAARRARMEAMDQRAREEREARRREWADRREEWLERRDLERERDRWADDRRQADRANADGERDPDFLMARDAFTGPQ